MAVVLVAFVCYVIRYIYVSLTLYNRYLRGEQDETGTPSQPLLEAEQREDPAEDRRSAGCVRLVTSNDNCTVILNLFLEAHKLEETGISAVEHYKKIEIKS